MDTFSKFLRSGTVGKGKYEVEREIARGGMSHVYKARGRESGSVVAIKFIEPEFDELAEKLEQMFRRGSEGEIAASLRHPNVVRTLEYGRKGKQYFIVMEYIGGPNLKQLIDLKDARWRDNRYRIALQVGRGLTYIHQNHLVHRDFCPKNVLLNRDGTAKVIDFGLALPATFKAKWQWDRSGTPSYMAPEQVRGRRVDMRTDIYAFGVSAYEILTGRRPFPESRSRVGKMQPHLNVEPPKPRQYDRTIPVPLEHIVLKAMSKEPESRYQTMQALMKELQLIADTFFPEKDRRA